MARITHHGTLWPAFEPSEAPGLQEVQDFLAVLSRFDEGLVHKLEQERGKGRDDYPVRALWNTVALMALLGHGKFSAMLGELERNETMADMLGYRAERGRVKVPGKWVVSRFWKKLKKETYREQVQGILDELVKALQVEIPELGERVAGDASDIRTHARPPGKPPKEEKAAQAPSASDKPASTDTSPKASVPEAETLAEATGASAGKKRRCADPEASWSVKTKVEEVDGEKKKRTEATFGYKVHALVDQTYPVVLSVRTTTGAHADVLEAPELIAQAAKLVGEETIQEAAFDKAYDDEDLTGTCFDRGIAAVIPVRDVPQKLKDQAPADREETLGAGNNITYDRYTGEVFCYDLSKPELVRRQMSYAGFELDRKTHKFRCPAAASGFSCGYRADCGGGCPGKLGRQVRIPMRTDPRRFAPIYPHSKRWKRAYNGRSASERFFSIIKECYALEGHAQRGQAAMELRTLLAAITLNASTLLRVQTAKAEIPSSKAA